MNPKFGNKAALHIKSNPPAAMTPGKGEPGHDTMSYEVRDWFRDKPVVGRDGKDLPQEVEYSFNTARVYQHVLMRNNTVRGLTFPVLVQYLDNWWYGYRRPAGTLWETMARRDPALQISWPKRAKAIARHGFEIQMVSDLQGEDLALAEEQQEFLQQFYDEIGCYKAVNPDECGGFSMLVRQMMESVLYYDAIHEIVWEPKQDGTLGATFVYCPVYWFEGTRGKLRYLDNEWQLFGREMPEPEWLVTTGQGVMECISIIYMLKNIALKSWCGMLEKFAWPYLLGKTHAAQGTKEWNAMAQALAQFGENGAAVIGGCTGDLAGNDISLLQAAASENGQAFSALLQQMDRYIAQIMRGGDLGTTSTKDAAGASLQQDESEIIETDDAKHIEETLNERVTKYALEWRFGQDSPKYAYLKLRTTPQQATDSDIKVAQFLLTAGGTLSKQKTYEKFNVPVPRDDEEVLQAPQPMQGAGREGGSGEFAQSRFANTFEGHTGRQGQRGGSAPRERSVPLGSIKPGVQMYTGERDGWQTVKKVGPGRMYKSWMRFDFESGHAWEIDPSRYKNARVRNQPHVESANDSIADQLRNAEGSVNTRPTPAQVEAGNYQKGHVNFHGLDISIENPKGSNRTSKPGAEKPWSVVMPVSYGYIRRTEGADGDQVDCYVGPHLDSDKVFIVDQANADTREFDEHKCLLGFNTQDDAVHNYIRSFSDGLGQQRIGYVAEMGLEQFKDWLKNGDTTKPVALYGNPSNLQQPICPMCKRQCVDWKCPSCGGQFLGKRSQAANCEFTNLSLSSPAPGASRLAGAMTVDTAPLAGRLAAVYALSDPMEMRNQLKALLPEIEKAKQELRQHSEAQEALQEVTTEALADGLAKAHTDHKQ